MHSKKRRTLLKLSGLAATAGVVPFNIVRATPSRKTINADTIKVGLIGCGGRGSGAANQALNADPNVVLHAMADLFEDKLKKSLENLEELHGDKVAVSPEHRYVGFDAYKKVLASGVDVVLLATSPAFRPLHMEAAVEAGKHIFCEKPVAVDAPGIRKVLEAAKKARAKNLNIISGFCWRFHEPKRASFGRINSGAIGNVLTVYNTYNTGATYRTWQPETPRPESVEWQMRNWPFFTWLSGDHIVEQAVHSIDMMSWAFGDKLPLSAVASGGRQVRVGPQNGNIYDHFAVTYEYPDGAKGFHVSRQQPGCENSYAVESWGTKGHAIVDCSRNIHQINSNGKLWAYNGKQNDMYQAEHDELFAAIRKGKSVNQGIEVANSSMIAILGRMAAYTGKRISWEEALNSTEQLGPDPSSYDMSQTLAVTPVPQPGVTSFK
ncbi:MAG: Gfo/Idh/MocA family oxidoreductase [Chitinophagaceae bacterium]|nr:Gfo/Idh/MocA family oxidoreductase [Chitinophagaceae bacterium]MCW5926314.1 Gfo/Idh/MocA family oxidoreductase [Chitinophagaceae bacterium]